MAEQNNVTASVNEPKEKVSNTTPTEGQNDEPQPKPKQSAQAKTDELNISTDPSSEEFPGGGNCDSPKDDDDETKKGNYNITDNRKDEEENGMEKIGQGVKGNDDFPDEGSSKGDFPLKESETLEDPLGQDAIDEFRNEILTQTTLPPFSTIPPIFRLKKLQIQEDIQLVPPSSQKFTVLQYTTSSGPPNFPSTNEQLIKYIPTTTARLNQLIGFRKSAEKTDSGKIIIFFCSPNSILLFC